MDRKIRGFFGLILNIFLIFGIFSPAFFCWAEANNSFEILVKFKTEDRARQIIALGHDLKQVIAEYSSRSNVEYAESDSDYKISLLPNDNSFDEQWYLEKIKAPLAWDLEEGSSDITIAVIDSGVDIKHPDLYPNIWVNDDEIPGNGIDDDKNGFIDDRYGWDFVGNNADPSPKFLDGFTEEGVVHGTLVAGIIAAVGNNTSGISGISWHSKIMPLRALDDSGEGKASQVVRAIDYAIANGADIINFSFVGFEYNRSLHEAITRAHKAGLIMVAAAGNEQSQGQGYNLVETPMYPACNDGSDNMVIGVAATDTLDQKADFSSYGFNCVDIAAPGLSIYGTVPFRPNEKIGSKTFDKYFQGYWSGTSMAAPIVAGVAALVESANRELTTEQVENILMESSDNISRLNPGYLGQLGRGRVNARTAVKKAKDILSNSYSEILLAPFSNHTSQIKRSSLNGEKKVNFEAYASNFFGGAQVASGDVNGDGQSEIIVGAGNGGGPHIRIFTAKGELIGQFFAYNENFRGGVNVAVGDVDGNGIDEIIAGAGAGGGPQVRIFNDKGKLYGQFFAYNENFRGGVNVASGDVDGNGIDEIIAGAGAGGGPQVRIFDNHANLKKQFFAYSEDFRGGVRVAAADIDGGAARNRKEIITAPGVGGGPHIRIFDDSGNVKAQFFSYDKGFRGGVSVAGADIDLDGEDEIVTGAGIGGSPHVRVFEANGGLIGSFYAYESDFNGGVNVGAIKIKK